MQAMNQNQIFILILSSLPLSSNIYAIANKQVTNLNSFTLKDRFWLSLKDLQK